VDSIFDLMPGNLDPREVAVYLAAIILSSFLSSYFWSLRLSRRSEALERVNQQLGLLYGPLRMLRFAGQTGFQTFKQKYFPDRPELFWKGIQPTDDAYEAWRVWLKFTLMPVNKQIERLLLEHGALIEGNEIPQAILDFFAHVSALEATIAQWDQGNYKDFKSEIRYPTEFNSHVEDTYKRLLKRRSKL